MSVQLKVSLQSFPEHSLNEEFSFKQVLIPFVCDTPGALSLLFLVLNTLDSLASKHRTR